MNKAITNPDKSTTVTFTGHCPNKLTKSNNAYKLEHYEKFYPMLVKVLEDYLDMGVTNFITGGAQGFDQLVFWAVNELQTLYPDIAIKNIIYIPFHGQENMWHGNDIFGPGNYRNMLSLADDVQYCTDLDNTAEKYEIIKALDYRNNCMCDNASRLCSLWSLEEYKNGILGSGGTANCAYYANHINMICDRLVYDFDEEGRIILAKNPISN